MFLKGKMFLFIRRVGARFKTEPPEDGFYFVFNHQCYKLTGDFIHNIYEVFMQGPQAFEKYRKTLKTVAPKYGCGAYYATRLWSCINKIYTPGYYESIGNANWFIEVINKSPIVKLEMISSVDYPTGYKDGNDMFLYENDLVIDANNTLWQIEITPGFEVCLKNTSNQRIKRLTAEVASSVLRKEF